MGWFVIAVIIGFFGYWVWQAASVRVATRWPCELRTSQLATAFCSFVLVLVGIASWASFSVHPHTFGEMTDAIGQGIVARFILGLLLGAGAAFLAQERIRAAAERRENAARRPPAIAAQGALTAEQTGAAGGDMPADPPAVRDEQPAAGIGTSLALSTALGITFLALAAPHLDRWLSHLTSLKSPVIELQVATATNHRISLEDSAEAFDDEGSLTYLAIYSQRISQDIEYLEKYDTTNPKRSTMLPSMKALAPAFGTVISPVAACVQKAINHGLSLESARTMIRPTAELLEQILFNKDIEKNGELSATHDRLWQGVIDLPRKIAPYVHDRTCESVPSVYYVDGIVPNAVSYFPRIQDYRTLPYLYVAAAYFLSFMGDDDKARKLLREADSELDFKDYGFLWAIGRLNYYEGKPGDISKLYFGPLDEIRQRARSHIAVLSRARQQCAKEDDLLCREQVAEYLAINDGAYFLAEDVARGSSYAIPYTGQLAEYAQQIKLVMDEVDERKAAKNPFYDYVETDRYSLGDTYAFAVLVLEARKANPDYDMIRNKVVAELERDVEHIEESFKNAQEVDKSGRVALKTVRAHSAAALELAGE
ncbi:MAG TPA: hypothetical protein VKW08_27265 [Xanthobacteraceae bacterium]|nr:hypothetical protein [Xanthobacteraceae bacterium]